MDSHRMARNSIALLESKMASREAAFVAYLLSLKDEIYIGNALNLWAEKTNPSKPILSLAYEIAQGTCRMALALDHIALALSEKKALKLKLKEKALLRTVLYQLFYLGNSPKHAIGDESVKLAKKYTSTFFAKFLNALIRKSIDYKKEDLLPTKDDAASLSIRFSFPLYFIERVLKLENPLKILEALNTPPHVLARKIGTLDFINVKDTALCTRSHYIQNITPAKLMSHLLENYKAVPKNILDLCASPGGKLLLAHEFFPKARLFANDVSIEKIERLNDNLQRFRVEAHTSHVRGESYSSDELFDLIILDVPCSNSGVFHKKPEARLRLNKESIQALNKTVEALIKNALTLIKPDGTLWYMTCSILPEENLAFLESIKHKLAFNILHPMTVYPENDYDGGFCATIKRL